jgi:hypothetical protein
MYKKNCAPDFLCFKFFLSFPQKEKKNKINKPKIIKSQQRKRNEKELKKKINNRRWLYTVDAI